MFREARSSSGCLPPRKEPAALSDFQIADVGKYSQKLARDLQKLFSFWGKKRKSLPAFAEDGSPDENKLKSRQGELVRLEPHGRWSEAFSLLKMPRHHTQPVSYLQQKAALSQFDDSAIRERRHQERAAVERAAAMAEAAREAGSIAGPVALGAAPGNDNVIYDPTHHAADYAGFVSRDVLERAHFA